MQKLLIIFLVAISVAYGGPREEAESFLNQYRTYSGLTTRLDLFSREFLGLPYGDGGPLGEGPQGRYDQDPLYRFDTFDCTTYVETMMGLALARDVRTFEMWMDDIRYENGVVDYLTRNHDPNLSWIPNNIILGVLREINHLVVPKNQLKWAEAVIDIPGWLKKIKIEEIRLINTTLEERQARLEELHGMAGRYSPMVAGLFYIPIATILADPSLLGKIPHGAIINFVRPNWDLTETVGTHMNISHQGLVFKKGKQVVLRHASVSGEKKIQEIELLEYLKRFENHPTMKGIHLMQMRQP